MPFTIPKGQQLEPFDLSNPADLTEGFNALTTQGGVLFGNIPEYLQDDGEVTPQEWGQNMTNLFLPELIRLAPASVADIHHTEARRQTHHAKMQVSEHFDPKYRDPLLWGETTEGASAEFRFSGPKTRGEQQHYWFEAAPGTLWALGGPSLLQGERVFHAVSRPQPVDGVHVDRNVTIGSLISK